MRYGLMTSLVLSLGASAAIPSLAKAHEICRIDEPNRGDRYEDRRDDRHEDRHRDRNYIEDLSIRDLPGRVLDRVDEYRHGRRIEAAQLVHDEDNAFYRVRIDDRDHGDFYLEVASNGHLLRRVNR